MDFALPDLRVLRLLLMYNLLLNKNKMEFSNDFF